MDILFVCTGNTCRSPMAEGILRSIAKEKEIEIKVKSGGLAAFNGSSPAGNAIKAMEEIGIDIKDHKSRMVDRELVAKSNLILTMSRSHKDIILRTYPETENKIFTLKEYAHKEEYTHKEEGDILDPFGGNLKTYQDTRDEIAHYIRKILREE